MSVDPFTFEIIRHKLMRVVDESVITLKHISGSSTTTEGHDLIAALYTADGSLLMGVTGYLHALPGAGEACRHIIREYSENPGHLRWGCLSPERSLHRGAAQLGYLRPLPHFRWREASCVELELRAFAGYRRHQSRRFSRRTLKRCFTKAS